MELQEYGHHGTAVHGRMLQPLRQTTPWFVVWPLVQLAPHRPRCPPLTKQTEKEDLSGHVGGSRVGVPSWRLADTPPQIEDGVEPSAPMVGWRFCTDGGVVGEPTRVQLWHTLTDPVRALMEISVRPVGICGTDKLCGQVEREAGPLGGFQEGGRGEEGRGRRGVRKGVLKPHFELFVFCGGQERKVSAQSSRVPKKRGQLTRGTGPKPPRRCSSDMANACAAEHDNVVHQRLNQERRATARISGGSDFALCKTKGRMTSPSGIL